MIPYLFVWVITYIFAIWDAYELDQRLFKIGYVILFLVLTIFVGTRFETGPDIFNYEAFFSQVPPLNVLLKNFSDYSYIPLEPAYKIVSGTFRYLGFTFNGFLLVFSASFVALVFKMIPKYSSMAYFSVMLYLYYGYFTGFSAIRQVLAAAIFFVAIYYVYNKNLYKYLATLVVATMFHLSAIVIVPMYWLSKVRWSKMQYFLVLICVFGIRLSGIISSFTGYLFGVLNFSNYQLMNDKVQMYADAEGGYLGTMVLEWLFLLIVFIVKYDELEESNKYFKIIFNFFFFGFIYYSFFSAIGDFGRIVVYFKLIYLIIIPMLVNLYEDKKAKFLLISLFSVLVLIRILISVNADTTNAQVNHNRYLPYKSWLIQ